MEDIHKAENRPENFLGIHNFAEQGIVGRGILVDFARWRKRQTSNKELAEFECFKATPIKLEWIKQILQEQGTEVRFGDILVVRSGFMEAYLKLSQSEVSSLIESNPPPICGVEQSDEGLQCESIRRFKIAGPAYVCQLLICSIQGSGRTSLQWPGTNLRSNGRSCPAFPNAFVEYSGTLCFPLSILVQPISLTSALLPNHNVAYPWYCNLAAVRNGLTMYHLLRIAILTLRLWAGLCMKFSLPAGAARSASSLTWKSWVNTVRRKRDGASL